MPSILTLSAALALVSLAHTANNGGHAGLHVDAAPPLLLPRDAAAPFLSETGIVNGIRPWPMDKSLFNQTGDCQLWYAPVPKGKQVEVTVCALDSYAFAIINDRFNQTSLDTLQVPATANSRCLAPNADKIYLNKVEGRLHVPISFGDSQTELACFVERFPRRCLDKDAVIYVSTSLKWPSFTIDNRTPFPKEYFKVPQVLEVGGMKAVDCEEGGVKKGEQSKVETDVGSGQSKTSSAGRLLQRLGFREVAMSAAFAMGIPLFSCYM